MRKLLKTLTPMILVLPLLVACGTTEFSSSSPSSSPSSEPVISSEISLPESSVSSSEPEPIIYNPDVDVSYREGRDFSGVKPPKNEFDMRDIPELVEGCRVARNSTDTHMLIGPTSRLNFFKNPGKISLSVIDIRGMANPEEEVSVSDDRVMFMTDKPINLTVKGTNQNIAVSYDTVEEFNRGLLAIATITTTNGTTLKISDYYYTAEASDGAAFNFTRVVKAENISSSDNNIGFDFTMSAAHSGSMEYFVPNNVFKSYSGGKSTYQEMQLGSPFVMIRDSSRGYCLSLSRYKPVITYQNNSYASYSIDSSTRALTVSYPAVSGNRKFLEFSAESDQIVYDMTIRSCYEKDYDDASVHTYNTVFNLTDPRIVATDIDEVYRIINEDWKVFLHEEEQDKLFNGNPTGEKYMSYGLPWRIYIESGEFGPYTYQAGFIGQQLPSAYNMMYYGYMNDDEVAIQNAFHINDFWVEDAEMMSIVGVPHIWYDTWSDGFRAYPCFLRMAVDAMEGLLDSYVLAESKGVHKESWEDALLSFGDFLVNFQNEDGSYYRCYNYSGGPFESWDDGIEEPPGNICQSTSKSCTAMPIRWLMKMYQITEDEMYLDAAVAAGEYVYNNIYNTKQYRGGTCDNPNQVDKEAGVYAMYAFDVLYTMTGEAKWLTALQQAAAFTMSTALIVSYPVRPSSLKAAKPLMAGYSDGMSFIGCNASSGVDNYIAFVYYELFRIYIHTGDPTYLRQAEFVQQNTKSIMDWDGELGYPYKSLVAEASSISGFSFGSVDNGCWVTWSSAANAEPITKMLRNFGCADVAAFRDTGLDVLRERLAKVGAF